LWPFAVEIARLVEQQQRCVLLIKCIVLDGRDGFNHGMCQVDFEDRLGGCLETTCVLQDLFHLPVIAVFRRNQADRALRQAVGCPNIGDLTGQFFSSEANKCRQTGAVRANGSHMDACLIAAVRKVPVRPSVCFSGP